MPCFYPITAYRKPITVEDDLDNPGEKLVKRGITFSRARGQVDQKLSLPCGSCDGCMLARASAWAVRATHESGMHKEAIFLTLTYSPENMPSDNLVSVDAVQKFLKRLRSKTKLPIRYMACGEYGASTLRPHYHLLLFGYRPTVTKLLRNTPHGNVYTAPELERLWDLGLHEFGTVTPASAGYVARYTSKKMFDRGSKGAEFLLASRQPPLGIPWLEKHFQEVYPADTVRLGGKMYRPPISYDRWLEKHHPRLYRKVWNQRIARAEEPEYQLENDSFRLPAKEQITKDRIRSLKRGL